MYDEIIILGVLMSFLFYELTTLSPGGIVVAPYLALSLGSPERVLYTLAVVLVTFGLMRLLGSVLILYGRRRFAVAVALSYLVNLAISAAGVLPFTPDIIGCLVPGILVRDMERQGVGKTLAATAVVTGLLALVMLWKGAL